MIVQPLSAPPAGGAPGSASSSTAKGSSNNVGMNQFLQLLVAQIQNQDPTNPADSTAFVTQLAQFSELEQVVAIRSDIENQTQTGTGGVPNPALGGGR